LAVHRGAFCQFPFRWIYYCHGGKSTGKKTGKMHLCAVDEFDSKNDKKKYLAIATPEPVCANNNKEVVVLTILLYVNVF
jgi:hypothetical protein